MFWKIVDHFPNNDLSKPSLGRPAMYPDWLLFLLDCAAGITGVTTRRRAASLLQDPHLWADFAQDVDGFVPPGYTRVSDLRAPQGARSTHQTVGGGTVVALPRHTPRRALPNPPVPAPKDHHLDYFLLRWRGVRKQHGRVVPLLPGDPWYGVRQRVLAAFRRASVEQAQSMGLLDPSRPFQFTSPDATQYVGFDGVVFPMSARRQAPSCDEHTTGASKAKVHGTKFTIASCRIVGQPTSRVILDLQHNGGRASADPDEAAATVTMAKELKLLTNGGMKGIVVDSVIRGRAVMDLERNWITVVNYPHAARNPGAGAGQRRGAGSEEKSYLRTTLCHADSNGTPCEHQIYFVGGSLAERVIGPGGKPTITKVEIEKYEQRGTTVRRQYFIVKINCSLAGDFSARVPLFHVDGTSTDPDLNFGEVARVFAPNTENFARLYGTRNDTESRHAELKSRVTHLPSDVAGQEFRLLGAALTANSVSWQAFLKANGAPNVIDDTA
jgi:hypothetical protein